MAEINAWIQMKNNKKTKPDSAAIELADDIAKNGILKFQEILLEADIEQALEFWLKNARKNFEDRGTISNYYAYIKDLLKRGILSHDVSKKDYFQVLDLNNSYSEIIERINYSESLNINDRRYRIKALLAFTKFLHGRTDGKVKKLNAPPMLMPSNDHVPLLSNDSAKPLVLTNEEFERLSEKIKSPQQRDQTSFRDYLVLQIMYQTARPLLDILALQRANINISNECIIFFNKYKEPISVPISTPLKNGLEVYLGYSQDNRKDENVFITREGKPIFRTHFYQVLKQASVAADLGFTPTFKMIQWAYVAERMKKDRSTKKIMKELKLNRIPKNLESQA